MTLYELKHRNFLPEWLEANRMTSVGVEVGVFEGDYSWLLHQKWSGFLIGVDPFVNYPQTDYRDGCNKVSMDQVKERVSKRFEGAPRYELQIETSLQAAKKVGDLSALDFVFIDGNHRYESVKEDIDAWWPKLRPGGLLGLHDFYVRDDDGQLCAVARATWEFAYAAQLPFWVTPCTSAWFLKPGPELRRYLPSEEEKARMTE